MNLIEQYKSVKQIKDPQIIDEELMQYCNLQIGRTITKESFLIIEQDIKNICQKYYPYNPIDIEIAGCMDNIRNISVDVDVNRGVVWKWQDTI